jgi:hypothetical protein
MSRGTSGDGRTARAVREGHGTNLAEPRVGLWVAGVAVALTVLLLHAGWTTSEWRGVVVSEVQILIVAAATYYGLRGES